MRTCIIGIAFFLAGGLAFAAAPPDSCISCHQELESPPAMKYVTDVHFLNDISCANCHGGDSAREDMEAAMDPDKGYTGIPRGEAIVAMCLKCHANSEEMRKFNSAMDPLQFEQFRNSIHGKADVATCVTCHGAHEIRAARDPKSPVFPTREVLLCSRCHGDAGYMKNYNPALATDQLEKYRTSVHGQRLDQGDTKVATCSSCHGAHDIFSHTDPRSHIYLLNVPDTCSKCHSDADYIKEYKIPTDQYLEYKNSVHGIALLKKQDISAPACNDCHGNHGAAPPGVLSVSHICGGCHALNAEYFEKSPHAKAFRENGIPQCEVCHGNHEVQPPDDEMMHVGDNSVCETCHSEGEPALDVAKQMYAEIQELKKQELEADRLLRAAEGKGMDVSDARFKSKEIPGVLIKARTVVHTMRLDDLKVELQPGMQLAQEASAAGRAASEEYSFRRKGLGISTLFITLLVVALYLKIRRFERRQQDEAGGNSR